MTRPRDLAEDGRKDGRLLQEDSGHGQLLEEGLLWSKTTKRTTWRVSRSCSHWSGNDIAPRVFGQQHGADDDGIRGEAIGDDGKWWLRASFGGLETDWWVRILEGKVMFEKCIFRYYSCLDILHDISSRIWVKILIMIYKKDLTVRSQTSQQNTWVKMGVKEMNTCWHRWGGLQCRSFYRGSSWSPWWCWFFFWKKRCS